MDYLREMRALIVLRRIFGPKGGKIIGGWRKLHSEEPCTLRGI
jgi:hypothetical protein